MSSSSDGNGLGPRAVALRYDEERSTAPRVVAKGHGEVAEAILTVAQLHGVPVHEDGDLLELLSGCDLGEEIPMELYTIVASLLTYLYRLNSELVD